jgi:hypothetical protein
MVDVISDLRKKWKNLFIIETQDGLIIFRPSNKGEFLEFTDLYNSIGELVEDIIFEKCVIYPRFSKDDIGNLHAGTVSIVAESVIDISGFSNEDIFLTLLDSNRKEMENVDNQILAIILKAFPYLTIEDINKFDIQQYTYRLALAEAILGTTLTIQKQNTNTNITDGAIDFEKENIQMFGDSGMSKDSFIK